jgi:predicted permease
MQTFQNLAGDVRLALRALLRDRGFAATALLTFALCLGANVALFAVVNAVLLRPLPFPESDRLVLVSNSYPKAGVTGPIGVSVPHYLERRAGIESFADAAAYRDSGETIGDSGSPDRVDSMTVTPSFFHVLQARPALGRTFTEDEATDGKNNVIVLSDGLWRKKFGADPGIIGRQVRLNGGWMCTVIGVMPAEFRFLSSGAQMWVPLVFSPELRKPESRHSNNMSMIARLKPGATLATAQSQLDAVNLGSLASDPFRQLVVDVGFTATVYDLHGQFVSAMKPVLLLLQAGVLFLLLIGVVNLANLMLVRASGRTKELTIRQALGAGRSRISLQLLTESLVLTLAGGVLGLGVAWAGLRGLNFAGIDRLPRAGELQLDPTVGLVALAACLVVGVLLALPVIWHSGHGNLATALAVESRGGTTTRATHRLRHGLIVAQFALAFVLLADAGLLGLSFTRVLAVNPGFQPDHVLTGTVPLPHGGYQDDKARVAFVQRLDRELTAIPGVTAAGFSTALPFSGNQDVNAITVIGHEPKPGQALQAHQTGGVTGNFFAALGIPLREGRLLTGDDTARGERVCVIDEVVARYYWGGQSPLGAKLINGAPSDKEPPFTIVGVVGRVKQNDLADAQDRGSVYFPYAHYAASYVTFSVRTTQAPESVGPAIRAAVLRLDPDLPVTDLKTLGARIDDSLAGRRSPLLLAGLFAGVALVLAGVGLYGVLAYAVAQRRREIGVRMALGARQDQIRTQFLGLGARLVVAGTALGILGAWLTGRAMGSMLYGVGAVHPGILALAAAVLIGIALLACTLPAVRAARVSPMEALRGD